MKSSKIFCIRSPSGLSVYIWQPWPGNALAPPTPNWCTICSKLACSKVNESEVQCLGYDFLAAILHFLIHSVQVDRGHYCSVDPYSDSPQPIGYSATISAPHMHAHACEYLLPYLHPGSRVLDVGSGSGYLTHVFARLITDSTSPPNVSDGHVVGIDHIRGLVDLSVKNMMKSADGRQMLDGGKVQLVLGDGRLGYPAGGPYDVIHVGAAAAMMHQTLIDQLKAPGRMFIPVESDAGKNGGLMTTLGLGGQYIWVVDKQKDGTIRKDKVFGVNYVPLTDAPDTAGQTHGDQGWNMT